MFIEFEQNNTDLVFECEGALSLSMITSVDSHKHDLEAGIYPAQIVLNSNTDTNTLELQEWTISNFGDSDTDFEEQINNNLTF